MENFSIKPSLKKRYINFIVLKNKISNEKFYVSLISVDANQVIGIKKIKNNDAVKCNLFIHDGVNMIEYETPMSYSGTKNRVNYLSYFDIDEDIDDPIVKMNFDLIKMDRIKTVSFFNEQDLHILKQVLSNPEIVYKALMDKVKKNTI